MHTPKQIHKELTVREGGGVNAYSQPDPLNGQNPLSSFWKVPLDDLVWSIFGILATVFIFPFSWDFPKCLGNPRCPPNICTSAHVQASLPIIAHPKHFGVTQFVGIHQGKFKMTEGRIKGLKIRGSVQDGRFVPNSQQHIQTQKQVKFIYFQDWSHTRKILILSMSLIWMLRLILMLNNFLDKHSDYFLFSDLSLRQIPTIWTQYLFFFSLHNMFRPSGPDHVLALT